MLSAALAAIADRFREIEYRVGGSVLISALGGDVEPGDIDIMVRAADRAQVERAAGDWLVGPKRVEPHPNIVSAWLLALDVEGVVVEVMGDLALRRGAVTWPLPMRHGGTLRVGDHEVPLAAAGPWVALYVVYRPERAAQLAALVAEPERLLAEAELDPGLGIEWP